MQTPEAAPVLDLIEAFRRSKTMFAALKLGIFEFLARGEASVGDIADELKLNSAALDRLLDGCVGLGLLAKNGEHYANLPIATRYLLRGSPDTLAGYILYSNEALYPMWGGLEDAVREGTNRWQAVFGGKDGAFLQFFRTPEAGRDFLNGMHGFGRLTSPAIVRIFNLNRFRHLVDLGGGTGHLAIAACERYGDMRATIFDLPDAVPHAREHVEASPAASRITLHAGDFFRDPLPEADLYALGRILHDWTEEKIARLLEKIHAALPTGGGILIAEGLLDDDGAGPVPALMQSLNMLICTEGRERTEAGYRALLERAGFTLVEARRTGAPLDAILALKK
jgi:acetylserotonin N-methyltransferase